jgi:hypothetical protein
MNGLPGWFVNEGGMRRGFVRALLLLLAMPLLNGCTALLWNKNTFAKYCYPATPPNLALFYSAERKDVLVQYDERREDDRKIHRRCYWLDSNSDRVRQGEPPRFVSTALAQRLPPVPRVEARTTPPPAGLDGLYAVASAANEGFTLYAGDDELESYGLPKYDLASGTGVKILLTPLAIAGDATLIGAVGGLLLAANSSDSDWDDGGGHRHKKPRPKNEGQPPP